MIRILATTRVRQSENDALEEYMKTVGPLVERAGGKLVDRYQVEETLIGTSSTQFVSIIEYPSKSAMQSVFRSEEYKKIEPTRDRAFELYNVCILV